MRVTGSRKFYLHANFASNGKMLALNHAEQLHFIYLLALKHDGLLEQFFSSEDARLRLISKSLHISKKACRKLKQSLLAAQLITDDWQPLGEGELWISELPDVGEFAA